MDYRDPKTGSIATQYTMDYLEECGLVKMDFLGLKTLTLIQNTLSLLKKKGIIIDIRKIPERDEKTFKLLSLGKSACVFQFESSGMQNILKRAKPEKIEDLIALNALYRPGPMENIDQFISGKHNWAQVQYPLPELEPILKETAGVIVYQEQVMEIARVVAGFTLGQADILRRAMGKKKTDVMAEQKERFVAGATARGYAAKIAEKIFDLLVPFAGYGFNKSHAAAYSLVAYQTAFLKANYPVEFMAANLSNEIHDLDKLAEYIRETRDMGIEILPPSVNLSDKQFSSIEGKIVFGLVGIKNVGSGAVESIIGEREKSGPFASIIDFLGRVSLKLVNKKTVEALILSGALDCLEETRATLFQNLERLMGIAALRQEQREGGQALLFEDLAEENLETLRLERADEWPKMKRLLDEHDSLGFYFSGHPLDQYAAIIKKYATLRLDDQDNLATDRVYTVVGLLKNCKEIITRTGKRMAFAELEDYRGAIELVIFSDIYEKIRELLVDNEIRAVRGKIDLSRGEPKLKADDILYPEKLDDKKASAVHIKLSRGFIDEENSFKLRDFLADKKGGCHIYFHIDGENGSGEKVIRASPQLSVSAAPEVLFKLKQYPQVIDVWSE